MDSDSSLAITSGSFNTTPTFREGDCTNDENANKSVCSISSSFISSSTNLSALSIGCRAATTEHRRHIAKHGLDSSFAQTPSPLSDPNNEDWERFLDGNASFLSASFSFFDGKRDISAIRPTLEPSTYDLQSDVDQSSGEFFADSSRLKSLITPEKNRPQIDEASRQAILGIRVPSRNYDDEEECETSSSSRLSRFDSDERSPSDESEDALGCNDFYSHDEFSTPGGRKTKPHRTPRKLGLFGFSPVAADRDGTPNQQTAENEELLAKVIVREILGLREESPMQAFDLSKLTIDETCEAHHMHRSCSPSDKSENATASPSIGSGFYSKDELCTRGKTENYSTPRKLGLFGLSPIGAEKSGGRQSECVSPIRFSGDCSSLVAHFDQSINHSILKDVASQSPSPISSEDEQFLSRLTSAVQDSPSREQQFSVSPHKKLFITSNFENSDFLSSYLSKDVPDSPKAKHFIDTSCITFVESEFVEKEFDTSFSSIACNHGGDILAKADSDEVDISVTLQTAPSTFFDVSPIKS